MRLGVAFLLVLLPAMAQGPPPTAGQQRPTFTTTTTLLPLDVTALDRDGKPVAGLQPGDFEVKINGSVQPVQTLAFIQNTIDVPATSAAEPLLPGVSARRRSEEHTSELQSPCNLVCRRLLDKKKILSSRILRVQ